mmetsp:Transcript_9767/g.26620  ORF Transcript_9767/g.26620 Transcript_9767/m.26620 type:complete len:287 (-) Transcript_9767:83-943(-)|eukprot:CAMPEP_0198136284 /NCGR_PEP_ID=MMETSP1442-20131203/61030_1 /TAXON_ID= /ORGANISM="Craspedostauros australis, Strain CCMP3328" /LENGTH=286 /DNA_ID=CAMNT_0043797493 /DNA_START=178 /DNA_END=1038 /DNA_ORIENTATION=+
MLDLSFLTEGANKEYVELIAKYYLLCGVFHIFSSVVSAACFPAYKEKDNKDKTAKVPTTLADKINWDYTNASILYCVMIFYYYTAAVLEIAPLGLEGRWTANTFNTTHGITLHIASSLYETTCYLFANKGLVFYLHHIVTVGGCGSMLFFGRASYWCCLLGLVEGTNIPLGFVLGGPFRTTPAIKNSLAYKVNGILLWVMYLVIRIPIPYSMYLLHKDVNEHGLGKGDNIAWVFDDATQNTMWVAYMDVVGLFLWGLSLMWFSQITSGMLKALGVGAKAKVAKKAA